MAFAKDYVDVATRLKEFFEKYPAGSLSQQSLEFVNIGGKDYVVYTAAAYRTPDDVAPGVGTAWEPIPGVTPYTKGSEVMVAETSAWGRALVALGADTKNGVASLNEVQNRQTSSVKKTATRDPLEFSERAEAAHKADNIEELRKIYSEAVADKQEESLLKSLEELARSLTK